jgi:integrase
MGPDLDRHNARYTFDSRLDAEAWLAEERKLLTSGQWTPPTQRADAEATASVRFAQYANRWLEERPLKPRTKVSYRRVLDRVLLPAFGDAAVARITSPSVRTWYSQLGDDRPTSRSHAYSLLRSILNTAVQDGLIARNPCHIHGAGSVHRAHNVEPATLDELEVMLLALPRRYRMMLLLAAWCGLRFGELTELRRSDIDLGESVLRIRRAAVRVDGRLIVGSPKSRAGSRDVVLPPHLSQSLREHMTEFVDADKDALLFPARHGGHMAPATLYRVWYPARAAAGRPDMRWHDLRHTGAVLAAQTGATLSELMERLGHSTVQAALIYQHAARGRDAEIARKLSELYQRFKHQAERPSVASAESAGRD